MSRMAEGANTPVHEDLNRLMEQIRGGSQEAVREVLDRYGQILMEVIRRQLAPELRTYFDSADIVQDVWASFFTARLQDYHFDSPEALLAFLARIASNKVCDVARDHMRSQKRNLNRVRSLDGSAAVAAIGLADGAPTPSQVALAEDQWERLLRNQPPHYRRVLELLRQGHGCKEIARELRLKYRTVLNFLDRAFAQLEEEGCS
jgi:RNA polymerase sigma factor (sigma-70 family)